jgi:hypothetical protein
MAKIRPIWSPWSHCSSRVQNSFLFGELTFGLRISTVRRTFNRFISEVLVDKVSAQLNSGADARPKSKEEGFPMQAAFRLDFAENAKQIFLTASSET